MEIISKENHRFLQKISLWVFQHVKRTSLSISSDTAINTYQFILCLEHKHKRFENADPNFVINSMKVNISRKLADA